MGRTLRDICGRRRQAEWKAPTTRPDPIEILIEQGKARLPQLLPRRYGLMAASPFAFLRGSAAVMAADLAKTTVTGLKVQAAGDCHCVNFGGFDTPEQRLSFDINDFDETAVAPWEWDVKRLATSFVVAAPDKFGQDDRRDLAHAVARSYRDTVAALAEAPLLQTWYRSLTVEDTKDASSIGLDPKDVDKADDELKHPLSVINVEDSGGANPQIKDKPAKIFHPPAREAAAFRTGVELMLGQYRRSLTPERRVLLERYRLADAAYKVVGVGSVGTLCGVALMVSGNGETLRLQFKEATRSVLEAFGRKSPYANHGQRVVRGQRLLQAASDMLLGFGKGPLGRDFYVRQLRTVEIKPVLDRRSAKDLRRYAETCGYVLARAHARSADAVVLSAYLGESDTFEEAIGRFALAYARQTESDHAALKRAIKAGRVPAEPQVS